MDSENPKGRQPSRQGGAQNGDKRRPESAPSRQGGKARQTPPIPGTLSRDGTPKDMPKKKAAPKIVRAQDATAPKKMSSSPKLRRSGQTGSSQTGHRTSARTRKPEPGSGGSPKAGKAQRQAPPRKKISREEAARARDRRLIITAIGAVLIIVLIIGVAVVVRGQLAKREERIVSQAEDISYDVVPCEPSLLDIDMTRTGSVAGYPVTFGLSITNASEQSCSLDTASERLVVEVLSGEDQIWSSAHCQAGGEPELYVFGPGVSSTVNVEWSGARSNSECADGLPAPRPGTYVVEGSIDGTNVPQLRESFVLTDTSGVAPAPEPEEPEEDQESEDSPGSGEDQEDHITEETPPPEDYIPD